MDSIDSNCDGWHVSSPEKVGLGSSLLGNKLLDQGAFESAIKVIVEIIIHHNLFRNVQLSTEKHCALYRSLITR